MNFDSFVKTIGVDNYYGMNEYNNSKDYDGNWGIFDEPFLQFMVDKVSDFPQPFFTGVFTLSSHHPYTIPQQHIGRFAKGPIPILEPVMYVDYALQKFFEKAKQTDCSANFEANFLKFTQEIFSQRRKTVVNNLNGKYGLNKEEK